MRSQSSDRSDDHLLNLQGGEHSPWWGEPGGLQLDTGGGLEASFPEPDPRETG